MTPRTYYMYEYVYPRSKNKVVSVSDDDEESEKVNTYIARELILQQRQKTNLFLEIFSRKLGLGWGWVMGRPLYLRTDP